LVFHLDEYASKYHLGRYPNETVREWFERVGFQKDENLFIAYESVRYGNIDVILDKHDAQRFEEMILDIKKDIKERNKK
jgi:hypothetical protein